MVVSEGRILLIKYDDYLQAYPKTLNVLLYLEFEIINRLF